MVKELGKRNNKGQQEIVGFAVIVVIVAVILLILLSFLLSGDSDTETVKNYEIESFISASLQYTTECEDYVEFLPLQKLISACEEGKKCLDERDSCEVLNETIMGIMESSWVVSEQSSIKGYLLRIIVDGQEKSIFQMGNETRNYKGAWQDFSKNGREYQVYLNVYYV